MVGRLYFAYITLTFLIKQYLWENPFLVYVDASFVLRLTLKFYPLSPEGSVDVAVDSLEVGVEVEKWYPVTMETSKTNGGEAPSIRLKFKYQVAFYLSLCFSKLKSSPKIYFKEAAELFVARLSVHSNAFPQNPIT